jgi:hypothetical protein
MLLTAQIILGIIVALSAFGWFVIPVLGYRRARRKGYRPPGAVLTVLAGFAVGIGLTIIIWHETTSFLISLFEVFCLPLLLATAAITFLILVLPRRKRRIFGARQVGFPFVRFGQGVIGLGFLLAAVSVLLWWKYRLDFGEAARAFAFVPVLIAVGRYLIRRGRGLKTALSLEERLRQDPRPPVLYMRAFAQEGQPFMVGLYSKYGAYVKNKSFLTMLSKANDTDNFYATFEQYFCEALENSIGPFIALGSPVDYLAPEGAVRLYAKDDDWREQLDQLARLSDCIMVETGKSNNLRWEFEHLRREGLQEKLFVVTRIAKQAGPAEKSRFARAVEWLVGYSSYTANWQEFSDDLTRMGYTLPGDDPGPGSVTTFDAEGRGILLTTQADFPADFVDPIRSWLTSREKAGRYVPVSSCAVCGRKIYVFPGQTEVDAKRQCAACRQESETKATRRSMLRDTLIIVLGIPALLVVPAVVDVWALPLLPEGWWIRRHFWGVFWTIAAASIVTYLWRRFKKWYATTGTRVPADSRTAAKAGSASAINTVRHRGVIVISSLHFVLAAFWLLDAFGSMAPGTTTIEHSAAAVLALLGAAYVWVAIALSKLKRWARRLSLVMNSSILVFAVFISLADLIRRDFPDSAFFLILALFIGWIVLYLRRPVVKTSFNTQVAVEGIEWHQQAESRQAEHPGKS